MQMIFEVFSFGEQGAWLQLCNARGKRKQPKRAAKTATTKTKTIAWHLISYPLYAQTISVILSDSEESVLGESELNIIVMPHALDTRVESIYRCLVTAKT